MVVVCSKVDFVTLACDKAINNDFVVGWFCNAICVLLSKVYDGLDGDAVCCWRVDPWLFGMEGDSIQHEVEVISQPDHRIKSCNTRYVGEHYFMLVTVTS